MGKLNEMIRFECITALKPVAILYIAQWGALAIFSLVNFLGNGILPFGYMLEFCSMIFIFIFGLLSFQEDFKLFLQNGFTRRQIFFAESTMLVQVAALLAIIDTMSAGVLMQLSVYYTSLFTALYGVDQAWWMALAWRFVLYIAIAGISYCAAVLNHRIGKWSLLAFFIVLWVVFLVIVPAALSELLPMATFYGVGTKLEQLLYYSIGYVNFSPRVINFAYPLTLLIAISGITFGSAYALVRRASLR